ncbi:MAG TPA: hypothetical protein VD884_17605 [Ohtaekwangia sp.]|nr:hypothetical protein [Ohtaekwangia sp.]
MRQRILALRAFLFYTPAGSRSENGTYWPQGSLGGWSSSSAGRGKAWEWNLQFSAANRFKVFRFDAFVSAAISVRCVRN